MVRVLVAGVQGSGFTLRSSEVYHPQTGVWALAPDMNELRENFTATLVSYKPCAQCAVVARVLAAGGFGTAIGVKTAELYSPS